jgi:hypothetical protein
MTRAPASGSPRSSVTTTGTEASVRAAAAATDGKSASSMATVRLHVTVCRNARINASFASTLQDEASAGDDPIVRQLLCSNLRVDA